MAASFLEYHESDSAKHQQTNEWPNDATGLRVRQFVTGRGKCEGKEENSSAEKNKGNHRHCEVHQHPFSETAGSWAAKENANAPHYRESRAVLKSKPKSTVS